MGAFSIWHLLILLAVVLLMFGGGGKIPRLMKDMGSGITAFKKGLKENKDEDGDAADADKKALNRDTAEAAAAQPDAEKKTGTG